MPVQHSTTSALLILIFVRSAHGLVVGIPVAPLDMRVDVVSETLVQQGAASVYKLDASDIDSANKGSNHAFLSGEGDCTVRQKPSIKTVGFNKHLKPAASNTLLLDATSRLQLGILIGSSMLTCLTTGLVIPALPSYASFLGLSPAGVGVIVAMPSCAKLLLNVFSGPWADRHGRKRLLVVGSLVEGIGYIGCALSRSFTSMIPPRLLTGAGSAASGTAGEALLMDVVGRFPHHTGFLLGIIQALTVLAHIPGPAIGGKIADAGGVRLPFLLVGLSMLALVPLYTFLPHDKPEQIQDGLNLPASNPLSEALASYRLLLEDSRQRALLAVKFALVIGFSLWITIVPVHAQLILGAGATELGTIFSGIAALGLISAPLGGALADALGHRRVIIVGGFTSASAIGALSLATGFKGFLACMAMWDIGDAMLTAASTAMATQVTPNEQRGAQSSLGSQVQDLGYVVMPLLLGFAAKVSTKTALSLAAVLMAAAYGSFAVLSRSRKPRKQAQE